MWNQSSWRDEWRVHIFGKDSYTFGTRISGLDVGRGTLYVETSNKSQAWISTVGGARDWAEEEDLRNPEETLSNLTDIKLSRPWIHTTQLHKNQKWRPSIFLIEFSISMSNIIYWVVQVRLSIYFLFCRCIYFLDFVIRIELKGDWS